MLRRLPGAERGSIPLLESYAARVGAWACAVLAIDAAPRLYLQAAGLVDPGDPVLPMAFNVLGITWGRAWALQVAAAVAGYVGFIVARRRRPLGWKVALAAIVLIAFAAACMGHPVTGGMLRLIAVPIDMAHGVGVGAWVGSLFVITRIAYGSDVRSEGGGTIASIVAAFHPVALWSATIVVATGTASVLLRVDHVRNLLTSSYGTLLFVKLGIVFVVTCFGAYNSKIALRKARNGLTRNVLSTLTAEVTFAALTIVVTAVLVATNPPGM